METSPYKSDASDWDAVTDVNARQLHAKCRVSLFAANLHRRGAFKIISARGVQLGRLRKSPRPDAKNVGCRFASDTKRAAITKAPRRE